VNGGITTSFPLPRGNEWYFTLENLIPGRSLIYVLHKKITITRAELPFCIVNDETEPISAVLDVAIKGKKIDPDSNGDIFFRGDLRTLGTDDLDIKMQSPPLWPVFSKWDDAEVIYFSAQSCEPSGIFDITPVLQYTQLPRESQSPGNLTLDFSELGRVLLQHDPSPDSELIQKRFLEIVETARESLPTLKGQFQLLRQIWFEPILKNMGFTIAELEQEDLAKAPIGVTAFLVKKTRIDKRNGQIVSTKDRIVVIVSDPDTIAVSGKGSAREYADNLCDRHEVQIALMTEGRYWMRHRQGSKYKAQIYDLYEIVRNEGGEDDFEFFLSGIGGL